MVHLPYFPVVTVPLKRTGTWLFVIPDNCTLSTTNDYGMEISIQIYIIELVHCIYVNYNWCCLLRGLEPYSSNILDGNIFQSNYISIYQRNLGESSTIALLNLNIRYNRNIKEQKHTDSSKPQICLP
jgi:hypothetical protein